MPPTLSSQRGILEIVMQLHFARGTLEMRSDGEPALDVEAFGARWDPRAQAFRAPAAAYADIVLAAHEAGVELEDEARAYEELERGLAVRRQARDYQEAAVAAWRRARGRGVVVLPTGAGKTEVGLLAMDTVRRSALVVAPTLDLVQQWHRLLRERFHCDIGVVGGGEHEVLPLTVTTYDSAYLQMEHLGNRFGMVIFDECHHLPGESYSLGASMCLAPYRLGLTATPERGDGREALLDDLIGECVFRRDVVDLKGDYLADYDVERLEVELSPDERERYDAARAEYRGFVESRGIRVSRPDGWGRFLQLAAWSSEGRRAFEAYQEQRRLAFAAPSKLEVLADLLHRHRADRMLVFTQDNRTAYEVSRRFLVPVITHQTKVSERSEILEGFAGDRYGCVVTSRVLNEGVDVPSARIAVVLSGSGSVREHVQRLGRILRKQEDKRALLYELVAAGTSEAMTSDRRRDHVAYQ